MNKGRGELHHLIKQINQRNGSDYNGYSYPPDNRKGLLHLENNQSSLLLERFVSNENMGITTIYYVNKEANKNYYDIMYAFLLGMLAGGL